MKRMLIFILAGLMLSALFAEMFPDVPEDHWAYIYVKNLYSKGIVIGYPDGTFKGEQPATRYEMAAVIARMYDAIEARLMGLIDNRFKEIEKSEAEKKGECPGCEYIPNILESLNALSIQVQFHDDKIAELFDLVGQLESAGSKSGASSGVSQSVISKLQKEVSQLKTKVESIDVKALDEKLKEIQSYLELIQSIEKKSESVPQIMEMLNSISIKLKEHDEAISELKEKLSKTPKVDSKIEGLEKETQSLSMKIEALTKTLKDIMKEAESKKGVPESVKKEIESIKQDLDSVKESIKVLKLTIQDVVKVVSKKSGSERDEIQNKQIAKINVELMKIWSKIKRMEDKIKSLESNDVLSKKIGELETALNNLKIDLAGVTSTLFEVARMATLTSNTTEELKKLEEKLESEMKEVSENMAIVNGDIMRLYRISGDLQRKVMGMGKELATRTEQDKAQDEDIAKLYDLVNEIYTKIYEIEKPVSKIDRIESSVFGNAKLLRFIYENLDKDEDAIRANAKLSKSNSEKIADLEKKVAENSEGLKDLSENLQTTTEFMYDELENLKNQLETLREGLFALKDDMGEEIKGVKEDLDGVHSSIKAIESVNSAQDRDIYTLYTTTDKLEKDTENLYEGVSNLETWRWINFSLALVGAIIGGVALYLVLDGGE